ncbi:hypothetical protein Patl1_04915 [Pistacia atlantica]|uniref:Uncharacterized protein n=1 Tax=Pistacia atlantica TaxID=434234 RepID=A0ACC1BV15_9ROSI|nr:hypothetical protein Patl1_04915 [Pistacia atlantica]
MALSVISANLIMPKANLQLPIFKPQKHPKNGIIKCCKPPPPPVKKGPPGQTNSKEKKMTTTQSRGISKHSCCRRNVRERQTKT